MDQKYVKTSTKQRVTIIVVAFLLLAATIATYVLVILNNKNGVSTTSSVDSAQLDALQDQWGAKNDEISQRAAVLSGQYLDTFKSYKSRVKAYNATSANSNGLKTEDLKTGTGKTLTDGDTDYLAYYIGWCADESVFDSSFDSYDSPTALNAPLSASVGLIEGWNAGVVGMKIGGVREITIPGELAYGDSQEICGGTNSPLKFIVMPVEDSTISTLISEQDEIYMQILELYYASMYSN